MESIKTEPEKAKPGRRRSKKRFGTSRETNLFVPVHVTDYVFTYPLQ